MKIASHLGEYAATIMLMVCLLVGALALSATPTIIGLVLHPQAAVAQTDAS